MMMDTDQGSALAVMYCVSGWIETTCSDGSEETVNTKKRVFRLVHSQELKGKWIMFI
jgi:hypothetical protein